VVLIRGLSLTSWSFFAVNHLSQKLMENGSPFVFSHGKIRQTSHWVQGFEVFQDHDTRGTGKTNWANGTSICFLVLVDIYNWSLSDKVITAVNQHSNETGCMLNADWDVWLLVLHFISRIIWEVSESPLVPVQDVFKMGKLWNLSKMVITKYSMDQVATSVVQFKLICQSFKYNI